MMTSHDVAFRFHVWLFLMSAAVISVGCSTRSQSTNMSKRFAYLTEVAENYGTDYVQVSSCKQGIIDALRPEDLAALATAYRDIERRDDVAAISQYAVNEQGVEARRLLMLMFLFADLGDRRIEPFVSGTVRLIEEEPVLDWSKLPDELRYVAEPAEKYGRNQFESEVDTFIEGMTPLQREELNHIGARLDADYELVERFLNDYRMTSHREAALIYFLRSLIGEIERRGGLK